MELINLEQLQKVLQEYAKEAVGVYRYQLSIGGHNASRNLFDSVSTQVVAGGDVYEVTISLEDYWKYLEGGSQGTESSPVGAVYPAHFPPVSALINWINVKPVIPRPFDNGKIPSPDQLAYLIGRKIEREGIAPYPALEETKKELLEIYRDRISEALGHDMEYYIEKVIAEK